MQFCELYHHLLFHYFHTYTAKYSAHILAKGCCLVLAIFFFLLLLLYFKL